MDTYNEKCLKGTLSVADFLLHVRGFFIVHSIWDNDVLELRCLYF